MRGFMTQAAAAAGTLAAVGVGTPVVATLCLPVVFPVVVVAGAAVTWRLAGRRPGRPEAP